MRYEFRKIQKFKTGRSTKTFLPALLWFVKTIKIGKRGPGKANLIDSIDLL